MTFKIEKREDGGGAVFELSGRIGAQALEELRTAVDGIAGGALDLRYVTLVDLQGVRFLAECERRGMELRHCAPFIREWMSREREA